MNEFITIPFSPPPLGENDFPAKYLCSQLVELVTHICMEQIK